MKIRGDFVTNSSSVSYILTMKKEIAELWIRHYAGGQAQLLEFIKNEFERNGQRVEIDGEEIYHMKINFDTEGDCASLGDYTHGNSLRQTDFSALSDDEMWAIIYGIIMEGKMDNLLSIGATMVDTY